MALLYRYKTFIVTFVCASTLILLPGYFFKADHGYWDIPIQSGVTDDLVVPAENVNLDILQYFGELDPSSRTDIVGLVLVESSSCPTVYSDATDLLSVALEEGVEVKSIIVDIETREGLKQFVSQSDWGMPVIDAERGADLTAVLVGNTGDNENVYAHTVFVNPASGRVLGRAPLSPNVAPVEVKREMFRRLYEQLQTEQEENAANPIVQ